MNEIREAILALVAEHLSLGPQAIRKLRRQGRLDAFTAVDSLFMVELVMTLEERFRVRFEPEHIDAELIGDLDRLTAFIAASRPAP